MDLRAKASPDDAIVISGRAITSYYELLVEVQKMEGKTFRAYVDRHKNLFADWIDKVYDEPEISADLRKTTSKRGIVSVLLAYLEKSEEMANARIRKEKKVPPLVRWTRSLSSKVKDKAARLLQKKDKSITEAFDKRYDDLKRRVFSLKKSYDTRECELYLVQISERLKVYRGTRDEKDAVTAMHLFYCLEEEIKKLDEASPMVSAFNDRYTDMAKSLLRYKEQGKDTMDCDLLLQQIDTRIKVFEETKEENDAMDIIHMFYSLEDKFRILEGN